MSLFLTGLGLFAVGALMNGIGWSVHKRSIQAESDAETFNAWLLEVVKQWFSILTGSESTGGQRLAAFGAIISAIGIVVAVVGIGIWAS